MTRKTPKTAVREITLCYVIENVDGIAAFYVKEERKIPESQTHE